MSIISHSKVFLFSYGVDKEIYYYLDDVDLFMNCGIDPIN